MASHVVSAPDLGTATWTDGNLTGDPALVSILRHAAELEIGTGPIVTGLDGDLAFLETCRIALPEGFSITPPIVRDDDREPVVDY